MMQENILKTHTAKARVQNAQCMEIENKKEAEEDVKKQHTWLASTKRPMKAS